MGPLEGITIIELAGIGPGPFCGMMLADMGATVIRVERTGPSGLGSLPGDVLARGRKSVAVNLKTPAGQAVVLRLCEKADAIFEGFRPGVAERMGVGPEDCWKVNPKLVYGRMTGWGQEGPMSQAAGHDINYISLAGALHAIGRKGQTPVPPLNLVGDFGGGGMLLAFGMVCALLEAQKSGKGQVVDAAMVDGAATLMAMFFTFKNLGMWNDKERQVNLLDGGAHFYDTYETKDGKYISVGSIEPQFYELLLQKAELDRDKFGNQMNFGAWPELKVEIAEVFKQKTRDEWCEIMEGSDVCFAPVLSLSEAPEHPHNKLRKTFVELDGVLQPAPSPRFSRTQAELTNSAPKVGQDTDAVLTDCGFSAEEIAKLRESKDVA
ncbi:alpha-methylacyl-CoA racemase [Desulfatibacillum alkenivorans DSM 16219]|jgi:alpha-methylacyl-CoA racemase|uniref:Alpha-methylacyl-CoA racemase n=1 Tax=Desulfatibacillum alkenivorans DSM 16219 TaxID=1121393 RepID=A0A1M6HW18_9BACT|nr:CaiB/BaiF CoA-transferase family protein [Desulfatibacillum alkenivorans]SHJ26328.1 alpha-methylacyl-CoA racemase [Desulfatibacillum alkenivorans DSM 16219]